jgi:hypothetical protein
MLGADFQIRAKIIPHFDDDDVATVVGDDD